MLLWPLYGSFGILSNENTRKLKHTRTLLKHFSNVYGHQLFGLWYYGFEQNNSYLGYADSVWSVDWSPGLTLPETDMIALKDTNFARFGTWGVQWDHVPNFGSSKQRVFRAWAMFQKHAFGTWAHGAPCPQKATSVLMCVLKFVLDPCNILHKPLTPDQEAY